MYLSFCLDTMRVTLTAKAVDHRTTHVQCLYHQKALNISKQKHYQIVLLQMMRFRMGSMCGNPDLEYNKESWSKNSRVPLWRFEFDRLENLLTSVLT